MKFKEKTTTVAIYEKNRVFIKNLTEEIREKTGTCVSVADFIEEFCKYEAVFCKDRILNDFFTISQEEADEIIKEIDNVS